MSETTIEWTEATWNPVRGCTKVSPGCKNCYAETFAERWRGVPGHAYEQGFDLRLVPDKLDEPLHWRKAAKVFVNSMSDLFHEDVPDAFIDRVFAVMALAPQHTFQILTKRAERMRAYFSDPERRQGEWAGALHQYLIGPCGNTHEGVERWCKAHGMTRAERERRLGIVNNGGGWHFFRQGWPLKNVWLGVSVENQHFADERIPLLLQTPAAVRFISAEPLLGSVDLRRWIGGSDTAVDDMEPEDEHCVRCGCFWDPDSTEHECPPGFGPRLDWVIVGGESGAGARPLKVAWARSIVQQCKAAGIPVFAKQLGAVVIDRNDAGFEGDTPTSWPMDTDSDDHPNGFREDYQGAPVRVRLHSRKGGDPSEWPADLRIREFPRGGR